MPRKTRRAIDVRVTNEGSIFLFTPITDAAQQWCDEHLPDNVTRWAGAIIVEHRYAGDIADGMMLDGLNVE